VTARWGLSMTHIDWPNFIKLAPLPLVAVALCFALWRRWKGQPLLAPYLLAVGLFAIGYAGLAVSLWPYIVPFAMTPADAAAADNALAFLLWGAAPILPLILAYTAGVYWLFRAKIDPDAAYH
jgi:cytochrome d ubiquinol oxidase subunit II